MQSKDSAKRATDSAAESAAESAADSAAESAGNIAGRRKQVRGDAVVQIILDATLAELADAGMADFSVDRVAARAGVNKTTIYRRWPAKHDLVLAALRERSATEIPVVDSGDVVADVEQLLWRGAQFMASPGGAGLVRMRLSTPDDQDAAVLWADLGRYEQRVVQVLRLGVDRGQLPAGSDPELLTALLVGALVYEHFLARRPLTPALVHALVAATLPPARSGW